VCVPQQQQTGGLASLVAFSHQVQPQLSSGGAQDFGASGRGATPPLGLGGSQWQIGAAGGLGGGGLSGGGQYQQHGNGLGQQGALSRTET